MKSKNKTAPAVLQEFFNAIKTGFLLNLIFFGLLKIIKA